MRKKIEESYEHYKNLLKTRSKAKGFDITPISENEYKMEKRMGQTDNDIVKAAIPRKAKMSDAMRLAKEYRELDPEAKNKRWMDVVQEVRNDINNMTHKEILDKYGKKEANALSKLSEDYENADLGSWIFGSI